MRDAGLLLYSIVKTAAAIDVDNDDDASRFDVIAPHLEHLLLISMGPYYTVFIKLVFCNRHNNNDDDDDDDDNNNNNNNNNGFAAGLLHRCFSIETKLQT